MLCSCYLLSYYSCGCVDVSFFEDVPFHSKHFQSTHVVLFLFYLRILFPRLLHSPCVFRNARKKIPTHGELSLAAPTSSFIDQDHGNTSLSVPFDLDLPIVVWTPQHTRYPVFWYISTIYLNPTVKLFLQLIIYFYTKDYCRSTSSS